MSDMDRLIILSEDEECFENYEIKNESEVQERVVYDLVIDAENFSDNESQRDDNSETNSIRHSPPPCQEKFERNSDINSICASPCESQITLVRSSPQPRQETFDENDENSEINSICASPCESQITINTSEITSVRSSPPPSEINSLRASPSPTPITIDNDSEVNSVRGGETSGNNGNNQNTRDHRNNIGMELFNLGFQVKLVLDSFNLARKSI